MVAIKKKVFRFSRATRYITKITIKGELSLGQYAISKPFPFVILITILIQGMQAGRRLIFCQPVVCCLVSYGDENEYGNDNGNEIED